MINESFKSINKKGGKLDKVDKVLNRWLNLQKVNKEEITLNEISKNLY